METGEDARVGGNAPVSPHFVAMATLTILTRLPHHWGSQGLCFARLARLRDQLRNRVGNQKDLY